MSLQVSSAPAGYPVTLEEVKDFLRITHDESDSDLGILIAAAAEHAQNQLRRSLLTQTLIYRRDAFPSGGFFLPRPPLQSVTSVAYLDTDGNSQVFDSANYQIDTTGVKGRIAPIETQVWPDTQTGTYNTVTITYVAGYGNRSQVPHTIRHAMLMHIAHMYRAREAYSGLTFNEVPMGYEAMIGPFRVPAFG